MIAMSGHSKWANIKVKKGAEDKKRSAIFTKMARVIRVAVKAGGGNTDAITNSYLRTAIEKAREVNMPKDNIERILSRFDSAKEHIESFYLEGFGPGGVPIIVEVESDNKIRTSNEVRLILNRYNGSLGGNNSVMFQFDKIGRIEVLTILEKDWEKLVEMGVWNIDGNFVEVAFENLGEMTEKIKQEGFEIIDSKPFLKMKMAMKVSEIIRNKVMELVDELEENEDVVEIFTGLGEL